MNEQELTETFKNTFNTIASGYDNETMRFFSQSAQYVSSFLNLNGNEHILDVATGTGNVALALSADLPDGQVTGIDISKGMLEQAKRKKEKSGINNISFIEMDMHKIDFPDEYFDGAVSGFGIFFVMDIKKLLIHIMQKVKDNGHILITTFTENSFSPLVDRFLERLTLYNIHVPNLAWKRVATKKQCTSLFKEAGLKNIKSKRIECGYYLPQVSDWWYILWNGGFRRMVNQLASDDLVQFKKEHFTEVKKLATNKGIWLEMNILFTIGTK